MPMSRLGALLAFSLLSLSTQAAPPMLELLVPAYFYPAERGKLWPGLAAAAAKAPLTVILNPANGPGEAADVNYTGAVDAVRHAGGSVIGYVYTGYGSRPLAEVLADIDAYDHFYNLDGIFLDEMANEADTALYDYYRALYQGIKAAHPDWRVIGNPGINTQSPYLSLPTVDAAVVFEDKARQYKTWQADAWMGDYDGSHFAQLVYANKGAAAMRHDLALMRKRGIGLVYVTNDGGMNPWDSLPAYWDAEVDCVVKLNTGKACR